MTPHRRLAWRRALRCADGAVIAARGAVATLAGVRWQAAPTAATLARAGDPTTGTEAPTAAAWLARAIAFARAGDDEAALARYRRVESDGDPALRRIARFDSANLYLRQALQSIQAGDQGRAVPLIELSKSLYRQLLAADPSNWDLRYNLERAIRLLPEEEPDGAEPLVPPGQSERAVTTMRGISQGMP